MEEQTYSLKQLYQYVTAYSKEANDEGFDMSVGDFVDWIASQDDKHEPDLSLDEQLGDKSEYKNRSEVDENKDFLLDELIAHTSGEPPYIHTFSIEYQGDRPCDCEIRVDSDGVTEKLFCEKHSRMGYVDESEQVNDKPVLPEKLSVHSSVNYRDPDEVLDILLDTQIAVNTLIEYLRRKEQ